MKISDDIVIDRPVTDVFDFVARDHHRNHPRWDPRVVAIEGVDPGPPQVGSAFRMTRRTFGKQEELVFRYTAWEPGSLMAYGSEGGAMAFSLTARLAPAGEGATRLTVSGEAIPHGPRALLTPLLAPAVRRQMHGNLARIKDLIEAEG